MAPCRSAATEFIWIIRRFVSFGFTQMSMLSRWGLRDQFSLDLATCFLTWYTGFYCYSVHREKMVGAERTLNMWSVFFYDHILSDTLPWGWEANGSGRIFKLQTVMRCNSTFSIYEYTHTCCNKHFKLQWDNPWSPGYCWPIASHTRN